IAPGADADIVLYDPNCVQTLGQDGQHSHANYTLYEGRQVTGKPVLVMQRGEVIVEGGQLKAAAGRAHFLATDTSGAYAK
ncbi:MAG TPA: dihydropyrimidinase, partial [Anaerolineae bacterium]